MDRSLPALWFAVAAAFVLLGCSGAPRTRAPGEKAALGVTGTSHAPAPVADPNAERYSWEAQTLSPRPLGPAGAADEPCGTSDLALFRVAERVAAREAAGKTELDTAELAFALRSAGAPYVWPRAWTLAGAVDRTTLRAKLEQWLGSLGDEGDRRCAVASTKTSDGRDVHAVVAVAALADLESLPTRVPVGTWLDLRARLLVPATRVEVIVLGPRGKPHAVLASLDRGMARARFRADREGTFLVQVLVTTEGGPRLAAEAIVAASVAPPESFDASEAPGEHGVPAGADPRDTLLSMVNGARAAEGLGLLRRDAPLDRLALEQAEAMRREKTLSHQASGAGMADRLGTVSLRSAGENAAHAKDLRRAHRSLWASPSHRENLLHPAFDLVGIGVATDDDGTSVWVCEIFGQSN
jgi:uncharacterized protein YkwD